MPQRSSNRWRLEHCLLVATRVSPISGAAGALEIWWTLESGKRRPKVVYHIYAWRDGKRVHIGTSRSVSEALLKAERLATGFASNDPAPVPPASPAAARPAAAKESGNARWRKNHRTVAVPAPSISWESWRGQRGST